MNGSIESGVSKDRKARFQVRCDHEPGNDICAMGGRSWQGRRFAQSRDDVIGIREFVHGRNGDTRRRSRIAGRAALRRGRRAWRGSATGSRQARWSASSWLRPSRWRSRGEVDAVIAAHAITAEDRRGSRCSLRVGRWRAAPSRRRAGPVLSRTREARAVPTRCASPWQAVAVNGDGEGRDREADRQDNGRSPGRPSRRRSRGEADGGITEGTAVARLLRGERPPTVRSTGRDAMPRPRRGGTAKNVEATLAEARTASDRRGERRRHAALTL